MSARDGRRSGGPRRTPPDRRVRDGKDQQRQDLLATVSPVAGVAGLALALAPPPVAILGLVVAALGFACGWQTRRVLRARIGLVLCAVAALVLGPGVIAPAFLACQWCPP